MQISLSVLMMTGSAWGHSWVTQMGTGGVMRGIELAGDLAKQRYVCPLSTLAACQPDPKHGITLTADAMRPCRGGKSSPMGNVNAGDNLYVQWAGNGHTGAKSAGTCVKIMIAPYASDPDFSAFTTLAGCLPYDRGNEITDGTVALPGNIAPGEYTIFWMWDFTEFWYSSCADIHVNGKGSPGATSAPSAPSTEDCKQYGDPNKQCQTLYGPLSYCKSWVNDRCGYSHCFGADFDDSNCGSKAATTVKPGTTAKPGTTVKPGTTAEPGTTAAKAGTTAKPAASTDLQTYKKKGCVGLSGSFCSSQYGPTSYCKNWQTDSCGRSPCQGDSALSTLPC